jgi:hypothetical protein
MSNTSNPPAKPPKHHYIPVFYLKQWRGPDRRVIEFSRPYLDKVKPRNVDPDGTGYVRGLYRLPGVADEHAEIIERAFFTKLDALILVATLGGPTMFALIGVMRAFEPSPVGNSPHPSKAS